jgi:hypothetical protein
MSQVKGTRIYLAFLPKHQVGTLMGLTYEIMGMDPDECPTISETVAAVIVKKKAILILATVEARSCSAENGGKHSFLSDWLSVHAELASDRHLGVLTLVSFPHIFLPLSTTSSA